MEDIVIKKLIVILIFIVSCSTILYLNGFKNGFKTIVFIILCLTVYTLAEMSEVAYVKWFMAIVLLLGYFIFHKRIKRK